MIEITFYCRGSFKYKWAKQKILFNDPLFSLCREIQAATAFLDKYKKKYP